MNTTSVMNLMPSTKKQLSVFVEKTKNEILSGIANPIDIAIQLKAMEDIVKKLRADADIRDLIISEAEKYGKTFETNGAKFSIRQSVTYEYNDSKIDQLKEEIKQRQEMLKNLSFEVVDPETGELLTPAIKKSTDSIAIQLM